MNTPNKVIFKDNWPKDIKPAPPIKEGSKVSIEKGKTITVETGRVFSAKQKSTMKIFNDLWYKK